MLRPIQEKLWDRGDEVTWFLEGDAVNDRYLQPTEKKLIDIQQLMEYRADVVVAPANSIPSFIPGLKVATFHGFNDGKLDRKGNNDHFKIRNCFDLYCTQGPNTTSKFQQMQKKHGFFNVVETGWPTLDPLFTNPQIDEAKDRPVIFLGSTFSKRLSQAQYLFPTIKKISRDARWKWIVSFHPKTDQAIIELYKSIQSDNLSYIETDNMIPILQQADIMVGDTSSALSMFVIQNKPVITVNNINPGPHLINITDANELPEAIETALSYPPELMIKIKQYIGETHPYSDGRSAGRVIAAIDEVLAGTYPLKKKKPLNFIRNFKFRTRLNYWKW